MMLEGYDLLAALGWILPLLGVTTYTARGWDDLTLPDTVAQYDGGLLWWYQDYPGKFGFYREFAGSLIYAAAGVEYFDPINLMDARPHIAERTTASLFGGGPSNVLGALDGDEDDVPQDVVFI